MRSSLFYLPSVGSRPEIERGMAGLRPELYQRMLAEISGQAKLADQVGILLPMVGETLEPPMAVDRAVHAR